MNRMECVRMNMEEDNGNRKESGNKEDNRRRESNLRVVCRRERKKRKGEWR